MVIKMSLKITGIGKGLPKKFVTNDELTAFLDTSDEWISTRTGVKTRPVCTDETLTELAAAAAKEAMAKAGIDAKDIDLIIASTVGGDFVFPSLSCSVAERLGTACPAFDLNAACSGLIYALDIASKYLSSWGAGNILIVCGETMSRHVDWTDRRTCVLFGDGASACVAATGNALRYIKLTAKGDTQMMNLPAGTGNSPFIKEKKEPGSMYMNGQEVMKFAVGVIERDVKEALDILQLSTGDIRHFVLHQANRRIIESARTRLGEGEEKFPMNMSRYGNISSVSIPLLLDELLEEGKIKKGDRLFLSAFGAGLTSGSCVIEWE